MFKKQVWRHPSTFIAAGPTGYVKTNFIMLLITHIRSLFAPIPSIINYYYSEWQDIFNDIKVIVPFINFHEG